jgi:hypothetical protein
MEQELDEYATRLVKESVRVAAGVQLPADLFHREPAYITVTVAGAFLAGLCLGAFVVSMVAVMIGGH